MLFPQYTRGREHGAGIDPCRAPRGCRADPAARCGHWQTAWPHMPPPLFRPHPSSEAPATPPSSPRAAPSRRAANQPTNDRPATEAARGTTQERRRGIVQRCAAARAWPRLSLFAVAAGRRRGGDGARVGQHQGAGPGGGVQRVHRRQLHPQEDRPHARRQVRPPRRWWRIHLSFGASLVGWIDHNSVLAHFVLKERLDKLGVLGCISCIVGSVVVVIHAPEEHIPSSVEEIWNLATQPGFLTYAATTLVLVAALIVFFEPRYGQTNILIYLGICSSMGSLTVVSIKAIGAAIKLTLDGMNQYAYSHTWLFVMVAIICAVSQLNYLNKALGTFDLAIVSPIYYVMFTTLTVVASGIMFKDGAGQSLSSIASEFCGLLTILTGTILLHTAKEKEAASSAALPWPLDRGSISWYISLGSDNLPRNVEDDYFAAPQSSPAPA